MYAGAEKMGCGAAHCRQRPPRACDRLASPSRSSRLFLTSKRILVVDDEPFIRTTVAMLLRLEGFAVASAADGRSGLQAALVNPPDVILSDVNTPHMNGHQLLAAVRDHAALRATRVVLLTGELGQAPGAGHGPATADAYLVKPFTREQLLQVLRSFSG